MKKVSIYITISLFVGNFSFAAHKGPVSSDIFNNNLSLFGQTELIQNDSDDVVLRKRAHRRKRKIRPRRNGF